MISTDTCSKVIEAQAFFGKKNLKFHAYMYVAGIYVYFSRKKKGGKGKNGRK